MKKMALERIAASGMRAHAMALEVAAENVSRLSAFGPGLPRSPFEAQAEDGVRDQAEIVARAVPRGPLLPADLHETLRQAGDDLPQHMTSALAAQRAFESSLVILRTADDLFKESLNLAA